MKEFKDMTVEELETRQAEIAGMETEGVSTEDIEARAAELEAIKAELETRKAAAAKAEEARKAVAEGEGESKEEHKEERKMTEREIRGSAAYAEAFKTYIITGDDKECRKLLSANAATPGDVPVPVLVEDIIKTAWESNTFLTHITKTNFRGNLKVPFEKSADPAYVHAEGTTGLTEEDLQLGLVELKPANIKKWISISDEAVAMGGEAFVDYIYREMVYRVFSKLVSELIAKANSASTTHGDTAIGIPKDTVAPGVMVVQNAAAQLSEEATDICVVLNPLTLQAFNNAYAAGNFAIDPFAGVTVIKCSALPAYSSADANAMYGIVGDLKAFQANYPEGEGVIVKWDDLTLAEDDLVKVIARQYVGVGVTAPGRLVKLCKPSGGATT